MLASDLDGTLIPPSRETDRLRELHAFRDAVAASGVPLAYVTGRHYELALEGIEAFELPRPEVLVCDVGTSVYVARGAQFELDPAYRDAMADAWGDVDPGALLEAGAGLPGVRPQEAEKQAHFKVSFYVDTSAPGSSSLRERMRTLAPGLEVVASQDPLTGEGLLDVLPQGVAKDRAVEYAAGMRGLELHEVVYAGDSANDRAALLMGCPAVLVANAPDGLRRDLKREAAARGLESRLYFARRPYAAGVIEGCRHFGLL